jgi:hypothetical protein
MSDNNCLTCKWSTWAMTRHKTPRIDKNRMGDCQYPVSRIALPACFLLSYGSEPTPEQTERQKVHLVPDAPFTNCRVWEKKDA